MLLNEVKKDITYLIAIMYELSEQNNLDDEKSNIKSSSRSLTKAFKKELNVKSKKTSAIETSNLLHQIKNAYEHDDVIQDIIQIKVSNQKKLPLNIIKNNVKLELKNCKIHKNLLYVNDKFYISNDLNLRIIIIKNIHNTPLDKHANKSFIYDKLSRYYYWSRMINSITRYVKNYHIYKRSKTYREDKQGLLKPLFISDRY